MPQEPVYALVYTPVYTLFLRLEAAQVNTLNFEEKLCSLEKKKKTTQQLGKRNLTLIGKINNVKILRLFKLIYCSSLLTVS